MIERYVSPGELRRLLSALAVVAAFLCLAAILAFLVVPGWRFQAFLMPDRPVTPVRGDPGWLDPTDGPVTPKRVLTPLDPATLMAPSPDLLARGKDLFAQHCATCHGPGGKGDGPGGQGLGPRNLTAPDGWKRGPRLPELYRTLAEGIPGTGMGAFDYLPRRDRMALAHFVQTLAAFQRQPEEPSALAALERSFAGGADTIPNHIPVRLAMALLSREEAAPPPLKGWPGDPEVREAVEAPDRAARTLAGLPGWRDDPAQLARGVLAQIPGNGFSPQVATWSGERWRRLHQALR